VLGGGGKGLLLQGMLHAFVHVSFALRKSKVVVPARKLSHIFCAGRTRGNARAEIQAAPLGARQLQRLVAVAARPVLNTCVTHQTPNKQTINL